MTLQARLSAPVAPHSLAAFRILLGAVMTFGLILFMASGWIEELFIRPDYFFKYSGFQWMPVWGPTGLYAHFTIVGIAAFFVCIGFLYRVSLIVFLVGFSGIQLMDLTNYLNHYYFVILAFTLLLFVPANCCLSVDVLLRPAVRRDQVPAWSVYILRFQVAIVYIFAAVAKLTVDWLMSAQPLSIWLSARTHTPLVGTLFGEPWVAFAMSWGGLLYDATIVVFLLWARTRAFAYLAVVGFHVMTWVLFDIGMFPFIMIAATTIYFSPGWPQRWFASDAEAVEPSSIRPIKVWQSGLLALWCAAHILIPLRHYAIAGDVLWNEQGMRYSWKVMVREKMGSLTYRVERLEDGRVWEVNPARYLQPRQLSEMSGQPDMIVQLAHYIRYDFKVKGKGEVAVRADALVSLNGRPAARLIDPSVDLTRLRHSQSYILEGPQGAALDPWAKKR